MNQWVIQFAFFVEPFSWTAFFISLALNAAAYGVNYLLASRRTNKQGEQQGEINIQNSQSGLFIPEVFGGDTAAFTPDLTASAGDTLTIDINNNVIATISGVASTIGHSFAWQRADDISWAYDGEEMDSVYNTLYHSTNNFNQNSTHYWPGKGQYFRRLVGDVDAGSRYFLSPEIIEPIVADFPVVQTVGVNGRSYVEFSGNETLAAQLLPYSVGGGTESTPSSFTTSTILQIFMVARLNTSATGTIFTLAEQGVHNLSYGERQRLSLTYFQDIDAFGFSLNDQVGDCYGFSSAAAEFTDWVVITAIVKPNNPTPSRVIRINGVAKSLSQVRDGTFSLVGAPFEVANPRALIFGAATTVQQSSLNTYAAANPMATVYSAVKNADFDLAETIVIDTTTALTGTQLGQVESVLMSMYGIT